MNTEHYQRQFDQLKKKFAQFPSSEKKQESFSKFCAVGWPTSKDEDWRYSKLNKIIGTDYTNYSSNLDRPTSLMRPGFDFPVTHLVFRNGIFDKQLSQLSRETMDYIKFKDHGCISSLPQKSRFHDASFMNLNMSFNLETFYLDIPENTFVQQPIVFNYIYESTNSSMYHPQLEINVGNSSQVKFIEMHTSKEFNDNLINPLTQINVQKNAKVKFIRLSDLEDKRAFHNGQLVGKLQQDSSLHFISMNLGGNLNRLDTEFFHQGENAYLEVNGLCYSKNDEQVGYVSRIFHEVGLGESHQLYKGVLDDKSSSTFDGLLYIAPQAQKVNSSQMNKNLLLSSEAQVNTKPQLDINADDVKAAHGATVSELNDDEIFYLMSRGIERSDATKIIERAFIDEIILKVGDLNIQKWLFEFIHKEKSI